MSAILSMNSSRVLVVYYAATAVFLLLDFAFGLNVLIAFLDDYRGWRVAYYGLCFACLGLMIWRPALTAIVSAVESLATLIALIVSTVLRSMLVTDRMLETGEGLITGEEIFNFLLSGAVAYYAWHRNMRHMFGAEQ